MISRTFLLLKKGKYIFKIFLEERSFDSYQYGSLHDAANNTDVDAISSMLVDEKYGKLERPSPFRRLTRTK